MGRSQFLMSGEFIVSNVPTKISTVLGSCVAVCIWDPETIIGGMNHYLLPGSHEDLAGDPNKGISSIKMLVNSMLNRGCSIQSLKAKVFGGGSALLPGNRFNVNKQNVDIAFSTLAELGISVSNHHTGGPVGRRITFNTGNGKVQLKLLDRNDLGINNAQKCLIYRK